MPGVSTVTFLDKLRLKRRKIKGRAIVVEIRFIKIETDIKRKIKERNEG